MGRQSEYQQKKIKRTKLLRLWLLLLLAISLLGLQACSSGGDSGGTAAAKSTVSLSGQVSGSGGLQGVTVSAGGVNATSDANGYFKLDKAVIPAGKRLVVTFKKDGYATYQRSLPVENGKTYAVDAHLTIYNQIQDVDQNTAQSISDNTGKVQLDLQADSLQGATAGTVKVSLAIGDPSTDAGRATFPGDYMAASSATSDPNTPLVSVAFAEITIEDSAGNEITELTKPATLTLKLPDEFQTGGAKAGTYIANDPVKGYIEWWSYDETRAVWIEEDADPSTPEKDKAAVVDIAGVLHAQAKVMHFTWWNADHPVSEHACYNIFVVDDQGAPLPGVQVVAEGVSYNGTSYPALTDANGKGSVTVMRSTDTDTQQIKVRAKAGNVVFPYLDNSSNEIVDVTTQAGSTIDNSGQCVDLLPAIQVAFTGTVNGTVTFENSGAPAPDVTVYTSFGPSTITDDAGAYTHKIPVGTEILLFVPGLASQAVTAVDTTPVTVNFVLPNRAPEISGLTQTPTTAIIAPGTNVAFAVNASDPDGDAISYAWSASAGTPASGTAKSFNWKAPSGDGTAVITVTVTDSKGAATSANKSVVYGNASSTNLKFTVKDDIVSNQPVAGVTVVLHGTDGRSVQQTLVTGADGIADFGDIGRTRATFSVGYERAESPAMIHREVTTIVDAQAGNVLYYQNNQDTDFNGDQQCNSPSATVSLNVTNIQSQDGATIFPGWLWTDGSQPLPFPICPEVLQNNGQLGVLGVDRSYGQNQPIVNGYGFLLDQNVVDQQTYTLNLDRLPVKLNWATNPATNIDMFNVTGVYNGRGFTLADYYVEPGMGTPASFGTSQLLGDFPAQDYYAMAQTWPTTQGGTGLMSRRHLSNIGTSLTMPMPNYSFAGAAFDGTDTFSWSLTGSTPRDAVIVEAEGYQSAGNITTTYSYEAVMPPERTSYQVVDLPEPLKSWVTPANLNSFARIIAMDFDSSNGFDDTIALFRTGADPEDESTQIMYGFTDISAPQPATASVKSASADQRKPGQIRRPKVLQALKRR